MYTPAFRLGLAAFACVAATATAQHVGPSTSAAPYVLPSLDGVVTKSILSAGEAPEESLGYRLVGIPDGMGALSAEDGNLRLFVNHELSAMMGAIHDHGATGAFVSEWTLDPVTLRVLEGKDLIKTVHTWDRVALEYQATTTPISRLCSGDVPPVSAFFDEASGTGTTERIFTGGEEVGRDGRAFASILTGPEAGHSYELPYLGRTSFENVVACPVAQRWTIVAGMDDSGNGQVYFYVGQKQAEGSTIEQAGLSNGQLWALGIDGIQFEEREDEVDGPVRFHLVNIGDASTMDGTQIETTGYENGAAGFLRPEDGHWDPITGNDFYFATTDRFDQVKEGTGTLTGRTRLYRASFDNIAHPLRGGMFYRLLDGTEPGTQTFDNICTNRLGHVILQEDPGYAERPARIWRYDIPTDELVEIARGDSSLFGDIGRPPTYPFSTNDETSGIFDASEFLGRGWYIANVQAHAPFPDPAIVEQGQLLAIFDPAADRATLELGPPVPGVVDTLNTMTVTGASPGQWVTLHHGAAPGYTAIESCSALSVQIRAAKAAYRVEADSTGTAVFEGMVPATVAGKRIRLQTSSTDACVISPVMEFIFR